MRNNGCYHSANFTRVPLGMCAALMLVGAAACQRDQQSQPFPNKPITIVVYTGPGGLIDATARKFTDIAENYTDATFVVENKPGAGGIVAMEKVLHMPADGYTLYACTKSNISVCVAARRESYLAELDWIAMLISDPECIITRSDSDLSTWEALAEDARAKRGEQIWVGPAMGGLDHVMAMKTWDTFDISAKWIPFKSGGAAKAALLGDQGVAYVGNPGDALGNPDLKIAVLSSPSRIAQFPDAPTFQEFGVEGLESEFMWRGFAVRKGTPPEALEWYDELFRQVTEDSEWREFWEKGGIDVVYDGRDLFAPMVEQDRIEFARYLVRIGIIQSGQEHGLARVLAGPRLAWILAALVLANVILALVARWFAPTVRLGYLLIPAFFISVSLLCLVLSLVFPVAAGIGPAAVPRLWIGIIIPLSLYLLYGAKSEPARLSQSRERLDLVLLLAVLLIVYLLAIVYVGYFVSTFVFLPLAMYLLGLRRPYVMLGVTVGWLLVSYWTFVRLLYVPLPAGRLWEGYF